MSNLLKIVFYNNVLIIKNIIVLINIAKLLLYTIYVRKNIIYIITILTLSINIKNTTYVKIANISREFQIAK